MSWLAWALVIFLTALAATLGTAVLIGRGNRPSLDRLADPRPLPGELPIAGRFELDGPFDLPAALLQTGPYGPFPVDTGPLLILSETDAAKADLSRSTGRWISETDWLIEAGEREIGPTP